MSCFSTRDFDEYRNERIKDMFIPLIKRIIIYNGTRQEKKQLFKEIRQTDYYQQFLSKRPLHSTNSLVEFSILAIFNLCMDTLLITILQIAYKIKERGKE